MKRILAYFLLASLMILTAPRSLFHDHHHHDEDTEEHHDHTSGDQEMGEDCYFCDYDLSVFNIHEFQAFRFQSEYIYIPVTNAVDRISDDCFDLYQHRGPPSKA